ncbi:hypothetical protein F5B21DRAFT_478791, partial [Xylaria acuta]
MRINVLTQALIFIYLRALGIKMGQAEEHEKGHLLTPSSAVTTQYVFLRRFIFLLGVKYSLLHVPEASSNESFRYYERELRTPESSQQFQPQPYRVMFPICRNISTNRSKHGISSLSATAKSRARESSQGPAPFQSD